nr:hypothetical protein H0235_007804 [Vespula pensylvanica]
MTNYEINVAISHVISWKLVTGSIVYNCFIPKLSCKSSQILKAASWNSAKDFNGFNQITMRKRAGEPIAIKPNGDYANPLMSATSSWRSFARGVGALLKGQLALCILQAGAAAA